MLEKIKKALRISNAAFDEEVTDLISAAQHDLELSGVIHEKAVSEDDSLIVRAVTVYCKANFGFDNPDAEKLQESYVMIKTHLTLSAEYTEGVGA
ncbi:head-tail connector protein [Paenibacillus rhizolycopersici]|uniref:head-tail connector protein n=1 Tax=Paenibacillus rhizolycopersici TaxID=2780073 RepID=UPI003D26B7AE